MVIVNGLKDFGSRRPRVVLTLGNFDGFHLGHQALLERTREQAQMVGAQSAVFTFEPHPSKVLRGLGQSDRSPVPRILQLSDLVRLIENFGIDWLIIEPFNREFAELAPEEFLNLLAKHIDLAGIIVGYDFAFGKKRSGNFQTICAWAEKRAMSTGDRVTVEQVVPLLKDGEIISSSRIRAHILNGEVEAAAEFMSSPYFIHGKVVTGEGRGRALGFRTANIQSSAELLPKNGVYITRLFVEDGSPLSSSGGGLPSVTNIGIKPTFHESYAVTVEAHILEQGSIRLEGCAVQLSFLKRLRDEVKFHSPKELIDQISQDVSEARAYFNM